LTTTEVEISEGKHYWEVELLSASISNIYIGISRPNLDPTGTYYSRECTDGWFMYALDGLLYGNGQWMADEAGEYYGNGKQNSDLAGGYKQGDRVGVMLDLGNGSLRFFKNGVQHGLGYAAGSVRGPVVAAVQMFNTHRRVRLLPNAEAPAGV
jgi:hypothetical protein